jgi:hypothetical protein
MENEKEVLFTIDGFEVRKGTTYTIKDREDLDAPSGFVDMGATMLPSAGVNVSFTAKYNRDAGVYDTGFYPYSPCYAILEKEAVDLVVEKLKTNLIEPFCQVKGLETIPGPRDFEFWDNELFKVNAGLVLNTDNPLQLMNLYMALFNKQVVPEAMIGDSRYDDAAYTVSDINKGIKVKYERLARVSKAVGAFEQLLERDKKTLISALDYVNLSVSEKVEEDTLRAIFKQHVEGGGATQNAEIFLELLKEMKEEAGKAKVHLYAKLKEALNKKDGMLQRNNSGIYTYNGTELGPDLKTAAENISKNTSLADIKKAILIGNDD